MLGQHVAKKGALRDSIIQGYVSVRQVIKPVFWHIAFYDTGKVGLQHRHRIRLYVQSVMRERAFTGEAMQIISNEHKIERSRIGKEDRHSRQVLDPRNVLRHYY